ncbi:MAG: hypothetical protein WC686_03500 [Candidatus Shapirobacteria bacterium]
MGRGKESLGHNPDATKTEITEKLGGEQRLVGFIEMVEERGGRVYLQGSAARKLAGITVYFNDVDLVVTGIRGDVLGEEVAKVIWTGFDVKVKERRVKDEKVRTIMVAREGRAVADIVCARRNNHVDTSATIQDQMEHAFYPDDVGIAYALTVDEESGGLRWQQIIKEYQNPLDTKEVRADWILLYFGALVRNEVGGEERARRITAMIAEFVTTRAEELVSWRRAGEPLDEWIDRLGYTPEIAATRKTEGFRRTPELRIRRWRSSDAEVITEKLTKTMKANPRLFWEIGTQTGLLPLIFPILRSAPSEVLEVIGEAFGKLESVEDRSNMHLWSMMAAPIYREIMTGLPGNQRGQIELSEEQMTSIEDWRMDSFRQLVVWYDDEVKLRSKAKTIRHAITHPTALWRLIMSCLPVGAVGITEEMIKELAHSEANRQNPCPR